MKWTFALLVLGFWACKQQAAQASEGVSHSQTGITITETAIDARIAPVPAGEDSVHLVFRISGMPAGEAKLVGHYGDQRFIIDSVDCTAGLLDMQRATLFPQGYYYFLLPGQQALQILLDGDQQFEIETTFSDIVGNAVVTGSENNDLYYESLRFDEQMAPKLRAAYQKVQQQQQGTPEYRQAFDEQIAIQQDIYDYTEKLRKEHPGLLFTNFKVGGRNPVMRYTANPDGTLNVRYQTKLYRDEFWDGFNFKDERLLRTPMVTNKLKRHLTQLTVQHPDSIILETENIINKSGTEGEMFKTIVNYTVLTFEPTKTKLMDGEAVFSHFIKKYWTPEYAYWSNEEEMKALNKRASEMSHSLLGKTGWDVAAKDREGASHTMQATDAPIIVVFIYAPDCEHCQEQVPKLKKFYSEWKPKGVEVYAIGAQTTREEWMKFGDRFQPNYTDVFDATNASWYPGYYVDVTPEIYVLNPNRTIIAKNLNVEQLPEVCERELRKLNLWKK